MCRRNETQPPQPDDHTLNACLARVIGKEIWPHSNRKISLKYHWAHKGGLWDPLHDANQMELVEAWLRENGYSYDYHWWGHEAYHHFNIYHPQNSASLKGWVGQHPDKKRAFALAVWQMEQSQKGGIGE